MKFGRGSVEYRAQHQDQFGEFKQLLVDKEALKTRAQAIIQGVKDRGGRFPGVSAYTNTVATSRQFAREAQASDKSSHNIGHLVATPLLYAAMAVDVKTRGWKTHDGKPLTVEVEAGIQAGGVHDSRRDFNHLESFFPGAIYIHGRRAAGRYKDKLSKNARSITAHHDDYFVSRSVNTSEFQVFKLADRLGLVRYLLDGSKGTVKSYILTWLLAYNPKEKALRSLKHEYAVVAAALYTLGTQYSEELRHKLEDSRKMSLEKRLQDPAKYLEGGQYDIRPPYDYQFDGFMRAAMELGMIGEDVAPVEPVSVTSIRRRAA